ncbi:hypothetical protein DPMN_050673 [Dreissena polymorpha]|uniref:Uncharacterized protein n=1 Tax=Dreissena polymorpha TaxID=45954 RepID=A0A9D4CHN4_DREPO|nr:hypothetical protein DPMN_050673 [Dreissena polymorpha]
MESRLSCASSTTLASIRASTARALKKLHVHHGNAGGHLSELGRAPTWHAYNMGTGSELSRQAIKSEPTRIRPTYPFPSLHLIQQGGDSGDELEEEMAYAGRTREKLVWVDALNKWVPEKQPSMVTTFVTAIHRGTAWNAVVLPWKIAVTSSIKYVDKNSSMGIIGQ